ncbi:MAG: ABC-2 family transporter protein [Halobacteriovoraceae bacterium]|nr:ABC-2 family transporter protein [Halobacteriovoraceae bacterium]
MFKNLTAVNISKWWITIQISWVKHTAYRLNFLLQIIGPALIFFFVKYNLWSSIYAGDELLVIKGFNFESMINYHIWAFVVSLVAQGHGSWNLAEDIRMGRISSYLIYPFNFWEFHTASWLSFQVVQMFVAGFTLAIISGFGLVNFPTTEFMLIGIAYTLFISLFWFTLQYLTGVMAFWLEETWILRVMLNIVAYFLSGAIIPLDLYPEWLVQILNYTPFPYLTYYPIKIFMGDTTNLGLGLVIISFWTIVFAWINHRVWKKGIRLYTAAGM